MLKQHYSEGDGNHLYRVTPSLIFNGYAKTMPHGHLSKLPMLHAEPGVSKLCNMMQDRIQEDN